MRVRDIPDSYKLIQTDYLVDEQLADLELPYTSANYPLLFVLELGDGKGGVWVADVYGCERAVPWLDARVDRLL